ncbi:phosphate ABC transporter membrane protein 1, PhoT family [Aliiroseovarius crassostreae]|uniref:Phosphate transport system permease protein n=1 Tax=Aliiroseovarius crassostreae TaxID=154981 RepID=A0A0P7I0V2_9RHOB|nr:phosphate ABC transporter permease subunit PstC [Aliiroseovarius crassostreae]KPN62453.1 ABC transporter permease [Aliiroseovarius crassostreae]SFU85461.1 phosphate ABC transporter membrane protein 1, PhoT family [Aliiroseovarius crassostreae]
MSAFTLLLIILALAVIGFAIGRGRALKSVQGNRRRLHSLPNYYGFNVAMLAFVPAVLVLALWVIAQPLIINGAVSAMIPESAYDDAGALNLIMSDVKRVSEGLEVALDQGVLERDGVQTLSTTTTDIRAFLAEVGVALGSDVSEEVLIAARAYREKTQTGNWVMTGGVLVIALAGFLAALLKTHGDLRARNLVERGILAVLVGAASIAILTTLGIVLSLIFNTVSFFGMFPVSDFLFGLTWSPEGRGGSEHLGILPLLWGTIYISIVALAVAVPIGLFAAIYLSEYANAKTRAVAKPLLEVLAGIPTIVYGLFALTVVGPLLVEVFGRDGLSWMQGARSVMTAGLVMGIMLIPFVSSLSDDIINAVPQAMRDGSYGLGATQSETVRQVVLPAALPGIVGAILLAASRAIGETMIVVMGAGAAARLSMNPFEAMTTVTAKIVSQLTGDADFASPEALVAFALGMTLFILTLGLNVLALMIVRKYREQYE